MEHTCKERQKANWLQHWGFWSDWTVLITNGAVCTFRFAVLGWLPSLLLYTVLVSTFPDNLFGSQSMSLCTENLPTMHSLVVHAVACVSDDHFYLDSVLILLLKLTSLPCLIGFVVTLLVCTFTFQWRCCSGCLSVTSDIFQWASNLCSVGAVLVSISSEGLSQAFGYCSHYISLLSGRDVSPFWLCNWWALIPLPVWSFWQGFCLMAPGEKEQGNSAHRRRGTKQLGKMDYQFIDKPDWCCLSTKLIHVWQVSALEIKLLEDNDKISMMPVPGDAWLGSGRGVWWCTNT